MTEDRLQSAIVKYLKYKYPKVIFCASLGGIYTSPTQAAKAKRTGYSRGFPDLFIYEPKGDYNGLAIELKTLKGRPTTAQIKWIQDLKDRGYKAEISKGIDRTIELIDNYLNA